MRATIAVDVHVIIDGMLAVESGLVLLVLLVLLLIIIIIAIIIVVVVVLSSSTLSSCSLLSLASES